LIPGGPEQIQGKPLVGEIGLAGLFNLRSISRTEIEFVAGDESGEDVMIINIGDIAYEICSGILA